MQYLVELLEKETKVYEDYLGLAMKKKQALIDNEIEILDDITGEEKVLSTKVLALEAARVEFLREQGYPSDITMDELLPRIADEPGSTGLAETADNLKNVLTECKKFNDTNMALLKQSSSYINHMIKVFSANLNQGRQPATYSRHGMKKFESGKLADLQG